MKPFRLFQTRLPGEQRNAIIQDFLDLLKSSKRQSVRKMIEMIKDLRLNGMETRYKKHLTGQIFELKDRTNEGAARVYFFQLNNSFVLTRAEVKNQNQANQNLLDYTAEVIWHLEQGNASHVLVPKPKGG